MKKISLILLIVMLGSTCIWALKIGRKILPDTMKAGDIELLLNGAGLRKKFIIKVYAGALYLPAKNSNAAQIAAADEPMAIKMHFIYKAVDPDKLIEAWNTGFAKSDISNLQTEINTFNSYFNKDAVEDDVYDIIYLPGEGTSLFINHELKGTIAGLEFKTALFNIWLSDNTELPKLRDAMLGN
ncbi:MAG: chalcone isomerase family protein [Candidatus Cloacimonetes bacterium]|nr:chalcone isomerase family protein [Candidatus Cloacimonadota bacterium]MCF7815186.1 chalcone isomerase family protein [Candidatus Cloacimonadota bacterium]MCF7867860.1 chalcone isomerase family protein [Candidatus Cloacimonadota bacterium]MCF7884286.1 chalcone isomerase family protein [Candidatus Cloacimonadota bacterium]